MKKPILNPNPGARNALTRRLRQMAMLMIIMLSLQQTLQSQSLAQWNFNGNNTGVAGLYNLLTPADFSPAITSTAYNSSVFYGEGGWPVGGLNTAAYFEFGLAPLSGHTLNIAGISMSIRRSSTGTPSGSGPTRWSLRSSMDGYTTDLSSGVLTPAAVTFNVSPGSSFVSLLLGVRFRIYGYQTTISSGGQSRLVMEGLGITGIGSILPARILNFSALLANNQVKLNYGIANNEAGNKYSIERSYNGTDFFVLEEYRNDAEQFGHEYTDLSSRPGNTTYYRLKIVTVSGSVIYSSVSIITNRTSPAVSVRQQGTSLAVSTSLTGKLNVTVLTSSGQVFVQTALTNTGSAMQITLPAYTRGIYHLSITNGEAKQSASVYLQ